MMKQAFKYTALPVLVALIISIANLSYAQLFGDELPVQAPAQAPASVPAPSRAQTPASEQNQPAQRPAAPQNYQRNPIISQSDMSSQPISGETNSKVFIYMRNFNIESTPSGRIMCSVRFSIMTNIPGGVNTLNLRFKWPKMTTSIAFYDVKEGEETYHDVTLLGEGCYTLDRVPNVIVNTCRIKGVSAKDCASRIMWVKAK